MTHRGHTPLRQRPGPHRGGHQPPGAAGQRRPHAGAAQAPHQEGAALWHRHPPVAVPPLRWPGGDPSTHACRLCPLAAPLALLPPGSAIAGLRPPARGQGSMAGFVELRGRRMDGCLLHWAGARGGGSAAPQNRPLQPGGRDLCGKFPPTHAPAGGFRVGAPQSPTGATPPRAPRRSGPGALMAHRGGGQLPPPPTSWRGLRGLPPHRARHPGVFSARGLPPILGPAGGFFEGPAGRPLPGMDHRARLHDRMGGPHSGHGAGVQMRPVVHHHARPRGPRAAVRHRHARGLGAEHPATAHHDHPCDAAAEGWRRAAPGPTWGGVGMCPPSSGRPPPPSPPRTPRQQNAPSDGDTHMGV